MKVVIDHVRGSRRGQRQELRGRDRVTFGRHPASDVSFDANRDLDASSSHAELALATTEVVLRDVGSSNGTFVGGQRIGEVALVAGEAIEVEFGLGGPMVRVWVGPDDAISEPRPRTARSTAPVVVVVVVAALVGVAALLLFR